MNCDFRGLRSLWLRKKLKYRGTSTSVGWESLLAFVKNSIFNGSKEVSLAAINCLQTAVVSHCVKVIAQLVELSTSATIDSVISVFHFFN